MFSSGGAPVEPTGRAVPMKVQEPRSLTKEAHLVAGQNPACASQNVGPKVPVKEKGERDAREWESLPVSPLAEEPDTPLQPNPGTDKVSGFFGGVAHIQCSL